jgi:hypothetical protein
MKDYMESSAMSLTIERYTLDYNASMGKASHNLTLCQRFCTTQSAQDCAETIWHESTHMNTKSIDGLSDQGGYLHDSKDPGKGYYKTGNNDYKPTGSVQLMDNADSYAGFMTNYYDPSLGVSWKISISKNSN